MTCAPGRRPGPRDPRPQALRLASRIGYSQPAGAAMTCSSVSKTMLRPCANVPESCANVPARRASLAPVPFHDLVGASKQALTTDQRCYSAAMTRASVFKRSQCPNRKSPSHSCQCFHSFMTWPPHPQAKHLPLAQHWPSADMPRSFQHLKITPTSPSLAPMWQYVLSRPDRHLTGALMRHAKHSYCPALP